MNSHQKEKLDHTARQASTLADWLHDAHSSSNDYFHDDHGSDPQTVNRMTAEQLGQAAIMLARVNQNFNSLMEELNAGNRH